MIKYFRLLLELLDLPEPDLSAFVGIAEIIVQHSEKKLMIHHRMGFVFQAWWEYLHDALSLEDFLATGDISSSRTLWHPELLSSSEVLDQLLEGKLSFEKNSLLLLDEISFFSLPPEAQQEVMQKNEQAQVLLLLC